jgi:hypothetical protein
MSNIEATVQRLEDSLSALIEYTQQQYFGTNSYEHSKHYSSIYDLAKESVDNFNQLKRDLNDNGT